MPTKITVTNPQPITVKVDSGKDQIIHSTSTFLGSANNFFANTGGTISGNVTIQGTTIANGNITVQGTLLTGNILPLADQIYNIGSPELRFKTLYVAANTIDIGGGTISANGNVMSLVSPSGGVLYFDAPANTTIDAGAGERAEDTANTAYDLSIGSYYYSGIAVTTATEASNVANDAIETSNFASSTANTAYDLGLGGYYYSAVALETSNAAVTTANTAANTANTSYDLAIGSYYYSGVAIQTSNDAYVTAQTAYVEAVTANATSQNAFVEAASANVTAQTAYVTAQTAIDTANIAFEIANSITLINYVQRIGDTILGPLVFLGNTSANLKVGNVHSLNSLDLYSENTGYSQLNWSNTNFVVANSSGLSLQSQNSSINLDATNNSIDLVSESILNVSVNNFNAITVYPNNDIHIRGSIEATVDGGNF